MISKLRGRLQKVQLELPYGSFLRENFYGTILQYSFELCTHVVCVSRNLVGFKLEMFSASTLRVELNA